MSEEIGRPVRVGIIGMGAMGVGLFHQCSITPGIECLVVCDREVARCLDALAGMRVPHGVAQSAAEVEALISRGQVAVCASGLLVAQCARLDAVIEASSSVGSAVGHALAVLENGKHLILMNSELDLTFGPLLCATARQHGVVCTSCDGDQYGVMKHLIDDALHWGFELVMAGNIKGFLDRYANPVSIIPEADKRNLDYRMCTSYTDGSKLNIEMAIIANAYGLTMKKTGMHGPRVAHVTDVFTCFDFDELWKDRQPFVDYILGAEPGGGVFVVGHCDNPYQRRMLAYYKMGDGPYYLFYRPYHLCHIEAMRAVLDAAQGKSLLTPGHGLLTNVYAYAKRDLEPGEVLDGLGGHLCYGQIESVADNARAPGLPICLAEDVVVKRAMAKDQKILLADVAHDPERLDFRLHAEALGVPAPGDA